MNFRCSVSTFATACSTFEIFYKAVVDVSKDISDHFLLNSYCVLFTASIVL